MEERKVGPDCAGVTLGPFLKKVPSVMIAMMREGSISFCQISTKTLFLVSSWFLAIS